MFERYSILSRQAIMVARVEAGKLGSDAIDSEHLLIGIACVHPGLLASIGATVELESLRKYCRETRPPSSPIPNSRDLPVSEDTSRIMKRASAISSERGNREVRTEHLLLAMAEEQCRCVQFLMSRGLTREALVAVVSNVEGGPPQIGTPASEQAVKAVLFEE